jgi:lysophospholipase L1-like esterase
MQIETNYSKKYIFFIVILFIIIIVLLWYRFNRDSNTVVVSEKKQVQDQIYWSPGWEQIVTTHNRIYRGKYGGLTFSFNVAGSEIVQFDISSPFSDKTGGIEIWMDGEEYHFSNIELDRTITLRGSKKFGAHKIYGRMYCTGYPSNQCEIRINSIKLDPKANVSINKSILSKNLIAVVGDSISVLYGKDNYTFKIADEMGFNLLNASIPGLAMREKTGAFSGKTIVREITSLYKPDIIIIALGTNDITEDISVERFQADYDQLLKYIADDGKEPIIVTLGLFKRNDYPKKTVKTYSRAIQYVAKNYDVNYIDPYDWLSSEDFNDTIHPKKEIQEKIAKRIISELVRIDVSY